MRDKTHFTVPHTDTDSADFHLRTKLPLDLANNAETAVEMRETMSPELQTMLKLTDMMALRSAALPHPE